MNKLSFVVNYPCPLTWLITCFNPCLPIKSYFSPPLVGFHLKLYKLSMWSSAASQPGWPLDFGSILPLFSITLFIKRLLFPGFITNLSGADSSCLNLFFDIFEYFARASFLAWMNLSYSFAASAKGFGIFLGGKYLGTFFTSSIGASSSFSFSLSSSSFLSFSSPTFFAALFVDSGTVVDPSSSLPLFRRSFLELSLFVFDRDAPVRALTLVLYLSSNFGFSSPLTTLYGNPGRILSRFILFFYWLLNLVFAPSCYGKWDISFIFIACCRMMFSLKQFSNCRLLSSYLIYTGLPIGFLMTWSYCWFVWFVLMLLVLFAWPRAWSCWTDLGPLPCGGLPL